MFDEEDAILDLRSQAAQLFALKTELSSDKIDYNDTIIYVKCNEANLKI